jgi:hypothetical protein
VAVDSADLSPVLCTYVPTRREDEFDTMLSSGIWSRSNDDLRHVRPWAFSRVASGVLLVVDIVVRIRACARAAGVMPRWRG